MAYINNPYIGYQPPQYQQIYNPSPNISSGINWVSGESGAKSWIVGKGETVLLLDSETQCFYIKSSDASGMPLPLRIFDYTERSQNAPQGSNQALIQSNDNFITRKEFDDLKAKYDELEKQIRKPAKKGENNESTV